MPGSNNKSVFTRIQKAFIFSVDGLKSSWKDEQAFRLELKAGIFLVPLAAVIPIDLTIRLLLIFSMLVVIIVELLNSAIEAVTDLVTDDLHDLAKKAKDCASAAVFISLIASGILWMIALYLWYKGIA